MSLFWSIWNGITSIVALFLPLGKGAARALRSPAARWALHILAVVSVLVLLYWLNLVFNIAPKIHSTVRVLADVWLPVLGLLVYSLAWLGWWLWDLLITEEEALDYPDIDWAWDAAVRALSRARIRFQELPLFLVLGRPEGSDGPDQDDKARRAEEALFHSAGQLPLVVKQTPADAQAPLHIYATRDAIYLTCAGASLLGQQAAILAGEVEAGPDDSPNIFPDDDPTRQTNTGQLAGQRAMVAKIREIHRKGGAATDEDRRWLRRLKNRDQRQTPLLKQTEVAGHLSARLRHLCRLLARDFAPECPVRGVLVLVPLAATDSDEAAQNTADCLARDLQTVRSVLKADCPQFALLCDMEMLPGFSEFRELVGREDPKALLRRTGQRFPLGTDLRGEPLLQAVEESVQWLCQQRLTKWIYGLFRVEANGREDTAAVIAANSRLVLLLNELHEREGRLARVLKRGVVGWNGEPRFGGCYVAGTGADSAQQAFVPGMFVRLAEEQKYVAWTQEAKTEDRRYHRLADVGYTILAGMGVMALAVVGWALFWRK